MTKHPLQIAIIGGGAAGFFAAITAAEADRESAVTIFEKSKHTLSKVKISGGGRCNVTHACFDPSALSKNYPRGSRELRGAFHKFQPSHTQAWFEERGVALKAEADGRMFPVTNSSQTIIDCLQNSAREANIRLQLSTGIKILESSADDRFILTLSDDSTRIFDKVCVTSGSMKSAPLAASLSALGHSLAPLIPSLFAIDTTDPRLSGLAGLSIENASVKVLPKSNPQQGPVLITHRGLSGPAVLRLSAWQARAFHEADFRLEIAINWLCKTNDNELRDIFSGHRANSGKSLLKSKTPPGIPRRFWERLIESCNIPTATQWSQLSKIQENSLRSALLDFRVHTTGKTTNKDEFVTCGGVPLSEVDFSTMQSRIVPNLHFAGECLDLDGITGGFNFQAAWTTGHIAGLALARLAQSACSNK